MASTGGGGADARLVRTTADPDEPVAMAVLRAVAAVADEPIESLPQLYDVVDPDALCEIVEDDRFEGRLQFHYDEFWVVVDGDHGIAVYDGGVVPKRPEDDVGERSDDEGIGRDDEAGGDG